MWFLLSALAAPIAAPEVTHSGQAHHLEWGSEGVRVILFDAQVPTRTPTWRGELNDPGPGHEGAAHRERLGRSGLEMPSNVRESSDRGL